MRVQTCIESAPQGRIVGGHCSVVAKWTRTIWASESGSNRKTSAERSASQDTHPRQLSAHSPNSLGTARGLTCEQTCWLCRYCGVSPSLIFQPRCCGYPSCQWCLLLRLLSSWFRFFWLSLVKSRVSQPQELLIFEAGSYVIAGACPVNSRHFSSIAGLYHHPSPRRVTDVP